MKIFNLKLEFTTNKWLIIKRSLATSQPTKQQVENAGYTIVKRVINQLLYLSKKRILI